MTSRRLEDTYRGYDIWITEEGDVCFCHANTGENEEVNLGKYEYTEQGIDEARSEIDAFLGFDIDDTQDIWG